jgi:thiosulfate/3-mercaptopyruvate sulfurtransferase
VVIYDASGGLWAARLFYGHEYYGHENVHLLDGGFPNWVKEGRPVSDIQPAVSKGTFRYSINRDLVADFRYIERNLENSRMQVIDTRSAAEYAGFNIRARRSGHIPGAIHIDWRLNLDDSQRFLSTQELVEMYDSADIDKSKTQVTHCQTGVRGAHTYFVLRHLGYEDVKLFDESWIV